MIASVGKGLLALAVVTTLATAVSAQDNPHLSFTEEKYDFGCVGVDFKILHDFKLVNHGPTAVRIDTVTAHCDCTEARFRDSLVQPGDTAVIQVIFDTKNFYGPVEKDIRVVSDDPVQPVSLVYYSANIGQWLASVVPDPVSVFFLPGQKSKVGRLKNNTLDGIELTGVEQHDDLVEVRIVKDDASKGESLELEITPRTDLRPGTHVSNFTVALQPEEDVPPLRITIPVKVVRY
jgi:hypothetical protein